MGRRNRFSLFLSHPSAITGIAIRSAAATIWTPSNVANMTNRKRKGAYSFRLPRRFIVALRAIRPPPLADSFLARGLPPFWPPSLLPVAGFFSSSATASRDTSPVAISTISLASWLGSRGSFGLPGSLHGAPLVLPALEGPDCRGARVVPVNGADFQTETLPIAPPASEYPHRARRSQPNHLVERGAFDDGLDVLTVKRPPPELSSGRLLKVLSRKRRWRFPALPIPLTAASGY